MRFTVVSICYLTAAISVQAESPGDHVHQICDLAAQIRKDVQFTEARRKESIIRLLEAMSDPEVVLSDSQVDAMNKAKADYIELQESSERVRRDKNFLTLSMLCLDVAPLPKLP